MHENEIGTLIVDSAVHLHQDLGPGLLETVYEVSLAAKLRSGDCRLSVKLPFRLNTKVKGLMKDGITRIIHGEL
jgi:PD-(D/E)XK nuclease superfamily